MSRPTTIAEAHVQLVREQSAYLEAEKDLQVARIRCTDALNRLNKAQQDFQALVDAMHKQSPTGSDWARRKTPGVPV